MEYTTDYFWVVVCKNHRVHHKGNIGYEHRILLGETDAFEALPMLPETVKIRCDNCDEEYSYKRKEVLRDEVQVPENFVPHPLFRKQVSNATSASGDASKHSASPTQQTVLGRMRAKISGIFTH